MRSVSKNAWCHSILADVKYQLSIIDHEIRVNESTKKGPSWKRSEGARIFFNLGYSINSEIIFECNKDYSWSINKKLWHLDSEQVPAIESLRLDKLLLSGSSK